MKKAAIPAVVTGVLGYGGGLFIPPTAVYDRLLRQNPNDFGGTWLGSAAGSNAKLNLTETGGRNLSGTLEMNGRSIPVAGNHDSELSLEGAVDADHVLKIGLSRKVGDRYGADDDFLLLVPDDKQKQPAFLLCDKDAMDITNVKNCRPLGPGITFFARKRGDPR